MHADSVSKCPLRALLVLLWKRVEKTEREEEKERDKERRVGTKLNWKRGERRGERQKRDEREHSFKNRREMKDMRTSETES